MDKSSGDVVHHVIFQCPSAVGKGVLVSPTVHGNLIVGPNAQNVATPGDKATSLPGLDEVALVSRKSVSGVDLCQSIRNFAGVRANTSEVDFIIRPSTNCGRMLHVAGIKSPGLSAAPAIGEYAVEKLAEMGVELKNYEVFYQGLEQMIINEICRRQMQDQVFVSSFNHISMQHFKNLCPDIQTGLLYDKPLLDIEHYVQRSNADNMHPGFKLLKNQPELMDLFHGRGMKVNTWTVNEEADMRDMITRGVDCIISNYPDLLCRVADELCK